MSRMSYQLSYNRKPKSEILNMEFRNNQELKIVVRSRRFMHGLVQVSLYISPVLVYFSQSYHKTLSDFWHWTKLLTFGSFLLHICIKNICMYAYVNIYVPILYIVTYRISQDEYAYLKSFKILASHPCMLLNIKQSSNVRFGFTKMYAMILFKTILKLVFQV